jgi:hypothetical protein
VDHVDWNERRGTGGGSGGKENEYGARAEKLHGYDVVLDCEDQKDLLKTQDNEQHARCHKETDNLP